RAAALTRDGCQAGEERFADAAPAGVGSDPEVLEVDAACGAPGRVGVEEKGEADGGSAELRDQAFERRNRLRELCREQLFGGLDRVGFVFVRREIADEFEDRACVLRRRESNAHPAEVSVSGRA